MASFVNLIGLDLLDIYGIMRQQTSFTSEYIAVLRQTPLNVWIAMARQSKPSRALA